MDLNTILGKLDRVVVWILLALFLVFMISGYVNYPQLKLVGFLRVLITPDWRNFRFTFGCMSQIRLKFR